MPLFASRTGRRGGASVSALSPLQLLNLSYASAPSSTPTTKNNVPTPTPTNNKTQKARVPFNSNDSNSQQQQPVLPPLLLAPNVPNADITAHDTTVLNTILTDASSVLLIGEADFSFARALAVRYPSIQFVATSFDSLQTLRKKYSHTRLSAVLEECNSMPNIELLHGVDCTRLASTIHRARQPINRTNNRIKSHPTTKKALCSFDVCWFVFPHVGGGTEADVDANRSLLKNFLANCFLPPLCPKDVPTIHISRALITLRNTPFYNSWAIPSLKFISVADSTIIESCNLSDSSNAMTTTKSKKSKLTPVPPRVHRFPAALLCGLGYVPARTTPSKSGVRSAPESDNSIVIEFCKRDLEHDNTRLEALDDDVIEAIGSFDNDNDDNESKDENEDFSNDDDENYSNSDSNDEDVIEEEEDEPVSWKSSDNEGNSKPLKQEVTTVDQLGIWVYEYDEGWILHDDKNKSNGNMKRRGKHQKNNAGSIIKDTGIIRISLDVGLTPAKMFDKRVKLSRSKQQEDDPSNEDNSGKEKSTRKRRRFIHDDNDDDNEDDNDEDVNDNNKGETGKQINKKDDEWNGVQSKNVRKFDKRGRRVKKTLEELKKIPVHLMTRTQRIKVHRKEKASAKKKRRKDALIRSQMGR